MNPTIVIPIAIRIHAKKRMTFRVEHRSYSITLLAESDPLKSATKVMKATSSIREIKMKG